MRLRRIWHPAALHVFYRLPLHTATLIDRATIRFAETGEGDLRWDPPHHVLYTGFHNVLLAIDLADGAIAVLRIYRARP